MKYKLTFSKLIDGFEEWFYQNFEEISKYFTDEAKELFETFEDFAVELYGEIECPIEA